MSNKTTVILGAVTIVLAVLLAAPLYAQTTARPTTDTFLAPVVVGDSCPLTDDQKQKSVDTFKPIAQFMTSEPRCVNCHGAINPFEANTKHEGGRYKILMKTVTSGGFGFPEETTVEPDLPATEAQCQACHSALADWRIPSEEIWFIGKDTTALCEQMKSQRAGQSFVDHIRRDTNGERQNPPFIAESFKGTRGLGPDGIDFYEADTGKKYQLEPPRGLTHEQLIKLAQDWIDALGDGAKSPDLSCGCQPPAPKTITGTLAFDVSTSYNFNTPLGPGRSATGALNHHEQVSSRWESGPSSRQFDATIYSFTTTNQIALDGSGNVSGNSSGRTTGTGQISASGTSHNPARPGDDDYQRSFGQTRWGVQGVNGPVSNQPARLRLYKQNGKDLYQITLGISQLIAQYTTHSLREGGLGDCSYDERYDNTTATRTTVVKGDTSCGTGSTANYTGPLLFGTISPSHRKPNPDTGQFGGFIQGAYDPTKGVIEGNENFDSPDCGETVLVDPLYDMAAALFTAVGAAVPRVAANGSYTSPGTTCHVQYTLQWHIQLPPQ